METPGFFGEWLKRRRKTLDLTQEELAARADCSVFALRKIESGERKPSKQLAGLLAQALDIPEEEQAIFIRVARGDLNLERLRASQPDLSHAAISDLRALQQTQEIAISNTGLEPATHHLPLPPTPLLGRDTELAALERLFKDPQCRLLTLTGVGGIGKTRLAIEFASQHRNMFTDGVFYVPLAPLNAVESIVPAIAEVLGYSFSGSMDLEEQLIRYMSIRMNRSALLVLDNLEHLIARSPGTTELVSEFLQRLPCVKILTTSRERLNLQGEWMYELHGLPVPPAEFVDKLDDYSATVLFIQSAQRINTDLEISVAEKLDLVRICRLVEGIPLAIELAAAWVGILTCSEIAQEIRSNIDFLSTSMRDMPERHRSLKATFEHSWRLLSIQERGALSRLSVFRGGFDRTAAEKVAGATLSLLASLVSKSLVRRTQEGRYDLHEVIRQYAMTHLDEDRSRCLETCDRHCDYYLNMASGYERKLKSGSQQAAMRALTLELDNLRTAWSFAIKHRKFECIDRAVRSFGWFFEVSGLIRDGIDQFELLVQALRGESRDTNMDRILGSSLVQQGLLYFRSGQFLRAQEQYRESIAILRTINDQALLADALIFHGTIMHLNGEYTEAKRLIEEGLAYAQAVNDPWFSAYGIYNLGHMESLMGNYQKGYEQMKEGVRMWRELGDPHSISLGLNFLVDTQIKLERYEEAKASMLESIALCEHTKNRWGMGTAYRYLGLATMANGQYMDAQEHFEKSLEIFGEYFEGWDIARSLTYLGDATARSGDLTEASEIYRQALHAAREAGSIPLVLDALVGLAELETHTGKAQQALEVSSFVLNHTASPQETKERANQIILQTAKQLDNEQILFIQERVSHQTLETIVSSLS